jgi:hypothetical protein
MPTPTTKFTIGVKASGTLSTGEYVKVTNLTNGGTMKGAVVSEEVIFNPADEGFTDWASGDTLSIEIQGRLLGSESKTITRGGVKTTVTATAAKTEALPAVSI